MAIFACEVLLRKTIQHLHFLQVFIKSDQICVEVFMARVYCYTISYIFDLLPHPFVYSIRII